MAPIKFKVENAVATAKEIEAFGPAILKAVDKALTRGALKIAGRMVKLIQKGSRTGRDYRRPGGAIHKASAPGEPPKSDTGFLASHIIPAKTKVSGTLVVAEVIVSVNYAGWLEEGTKAEDGSVKMAARPFVSPSFDLEAPGINKDVSKAIRQALR